MDAETRHAREIEPERGAHLLSALGHEGDELLVEGDGLSRQGRTGRLDVEHAAERPADGERNRDLRGDPGELGDEVGIAPRVANELRLSARTARAITPWSSEKP